MLKRVLIFFWIFLVGLETSGWAREFLDALGSKIEVVSAPQRVVALAPSLGEMTALLLEDQINRVVGVTLKSDFPEALKKVESIGPYHHFSIEKVLSLHPDLVFATTEGNSKEQVLRLRELGIPVVVTQQRNLSEIESTLRLMSQVLGVPGRGESQIATFHEELEKLRKKFHSRDPKKVLLQLGDHPLIVAGGKSFLDDCLIQIGGLNLYGDSGQPYPRPSFEDAVKRNPDVVVILAMSEPEELAQSMRAQWMRIKTLKAGQSGRVRLLKSNELLRPTLRVLNGLRELGDLIYGS